MVDLVVEAEGAAELEFAGDHRGEVDAARLVGRNADEYDDSGAAGRVDRGADRGRYGGAFEDDVEVPDGTSGSRTTNEPFAPSW